jgi:hypothetical protein
MNETEGRDIKIDAVKNWLKTQPKSFFSDRIKEKNCETLEPVF